MRGSSKLAVSMSLVCGLGLGIAGTALAEPAAPAAPSMPAASDAATSAPATPAAAAAPSDAPEEAAEQAPAFIGVELQDDKGTALGESGIVVGHTVTIVPRMSGDATGYTYNYVWLTGADWGGKDQVWDSTVRSTGKATAATTGSFTPQRTGLYTVFVDVIAPDGTTQTKLARVQVQDQSINFTGITLSGGTETTPVTVKSGAPITITPEVSGDTQGLLYNYVWVRGNYWGKDNWSSDVRETGKNTTSTSKTLSFTTPGFYHIFVDVVTSGGTKTTLEAQVQVVDLDYDLTNVLLFQNNEPLSAGSTIKSGTTITVGSQTTGENNSLSYNYVWQRNNSWAKGDWSSDVYETGKTTSALTKNLTLTTPGTYNIYVDAVSPSGKKITKGTTVKVVDYNYNFSGFAISTADKSYETYKLVKPGTALTLTPQVTGETEKLTYNYVWQRNNSWDKGEWSSTRLETGQDTTNTQGVITPQKEGEYNLYVDVVSPSGKRTTKAQKVIVSNKDFLYQGVQVTDAYDKNVAGGFVAPGTKLTYRPDLIGTTEGLTYNYVWQCNYSWAKGQWDSTINSTGKATSATSGTITPSVAGVYSLHIDVFDKQGNKQTLTQQVTVATLRSIRAQATGASTWNLSFDAGAQLAANNQIPTRFTWRYVSGNGRETDLGGWGTATQKSFNAAWNGYKAGTYEFAVYLKDTSGRTQRVTTRVNYAPQVKVGWQNPAGYYQVSPSTVKLPKAAYSTPFSYVTPSRISANATREQCIEAFIQRAYEYVGTPYRWNYSRQPGVGVDCIGLVYQCAYATGMDLGEFNPYDHWYSGWNGWHSHDANNMWNYGKIRRIPLSQRQRGDLIFWNGHVAIYLGNDMMIEATSPRVVVSSIWRYGTPKGAAQLYIR